MPPELETPRLRLRMFTQDDLDIYHDRIYGDAGVMQRYDPGAEPKSKAYTQEMLDHFMEYWNEHPLGVWAVIEKASNEFIGYAGLLYFKGQPEVEVLYALGKAYWGKEYVGEAALASLRYGFETVGLERIYAIAFTENKASQRVMQKIGMQYEGITNRFYDMEFECYVMTREMFQASSQAR